MVPNNLVCSVEDDRVGIGRGVTLAGTLKHAQVIIAVAKGNHVINLQFFSQMVDPVAFATEAVVNVDPVQSGFLVRARPFPARESQCLSRRQGEAHQGMLALTFHASRYPARRR
ncbi:MAG: hypothetical protein CM15mP125_1630 [Gammaproteobacteria bacterium]|nr:MAG: hypothetical protein CM15mP125_1630 [Gammaproteobacteria bacterium]